MSQKHPTKLTILCYLLLQQVVNLPQALFTDCKLVHLLGKLEVD